MRTSDTRMLHGTPGSPQLSIDQLEGKVQSIENARVLYEQLQEADELLDELERQGTKLNREEVVFVTRDATGQIIWLERGNARAGLEHILHGGNGGRGHAEDFERLCGVSEQELPRFLQRVMSQGEVVSNTLKPIGNSGRMGYERIYYYSGSYHIITGIGSNGFIVSAYPRPIK